MKNAKKWTEQEIIEAMKEMLKVDNLTEADRDRVIDWAERKLEGLKK